MPRWGAHRMAAEIFTSPTWFTTWSTTWDHTKNLTICTQDGQPLVS